MIYVKYEDGHNDSIYMSFVDIGALVDHIWNPHCSDNKKIIEVLIELDGEYVDCGDKWTVVDEMSVRHEARALLRIADKMRADEEL